MLNNEQVDRVKDLLRRLESFSFEERSLCFSAGSLSDFLLILLPPLLTARSPDAIIDHWESTFPSFLEELASRAASEAAIVTHDRRQFLLITKNVASDFVNSSWWSENCPDGIPRLRSR